MKFLVEVWGFIKTVSGTHSLTDINSKAFMFLGMASRLTPSQNLSILFTAKAWSFTKKRFWHRSSIINKAIRAILSLLIFFFFLRKDFECTKTRHKQKLTNKTKLSKQKTTKATIFRVQKGSERVKVVCFAFWCFLYA